MSIENAEKLLAKLKKDKALGEKLQTATRTAFENIAKEAGLACTSEDVKTVMDKMMKSGELSEEELGKMSGGDTAWTANGSLCRACTCV